MKRLAVVIIACALVVGWNTYGYCQDETRDDASIEQSESQMDEGLSSEIESDRAQGEAEVGEVETSMDTGGQIQ